MSRPGVPLHSGTRDLIRLEQMSADWDERQFLVWAMRGIRRLRGLEDEADNQRPFPPLRLFPSADMFAQFRAAVETAIEIGLQWPEHLERVLLDHLDRMTPRAPDEFKEQLYLWRLLEQFRCATRVVATASHSLRMCSGALDRCEYAGVADLVNSIVKTVEHSKSTPTKIAQFFSDLARSSFWSDSFLGLYLRAWIGERRNTEFGPDENCSAWRRLVDSHLGPSLAANSAGVAAFLAEDGYLTGLGELLGFLNDGAAISAEDRLRAFCAIDCLLTIDGDGIWESRGETEFLRADILELVS